MFRILSNDFDVIETVTEYTSIQWKKRFRESGSFTIQLPPTFSTETDLKGKLIRHRDYYGIIEYIDATSSGFQLQGHDLKVLMAYRVGKGEYSGKSENIIKTFVNDNTQGNRSFEHFSVAADRQEGTQTTYNFEKSDSLENHLAKFCTEYDLGYDISVSDKSMIFDVLTPKTVDYIYSERRHNISEYEYNYNALSEKNIVINNAKTKVDVKIEDTITYISGTVVFSDGELMNIDKNYSRDFSSSRNRLYLEKKKSTKTLDIRYTTSAGIVDTSTYEYQYLGYVDTSDSNKFIMNEDFKDYSYSYYTADDEPSGIARKETPSNIDESMDALAEEGKKLLSENKPAETITADILTYSDYKTVWNIGDYVSIKIRLFNSVMTVSRQITEVDEVYEPNSIKIIPTFGQAKTSVIKKLLKGRL